MLLGLVLLLCAMAGCGPLLPTAPTQRAYFVLADNGSIPEVGVKLPLNVLVRDTRANSFINSQKIIFGDEPGSRGFYQLAQWVEPPPERITLLLVERLERMKVFSAAARLTSSTLGDLQVNPEILELYHDTSAEPGTAKVVIDVELIDLRNRTIIRKRDFRRDVPVETYDAPGARDAMSKGVNAILDEIALWTVDTASEALRAGPTEAGPEGGISPK